MEQEETAQHVTLQPISPLSKHQPYTYSTAQPSILLLWFSNGTGISMYDTTGEVRIEHTNITESCVRTNSSDIVSGGGGGMHIEFTFCAPSTSSCWNYCITNSKRHGSNATYTLNNCTFVRNAVSANKDILAHVGSSSIGNGGDAYIVFSPKSL